MTGKGIGKLLRKAALAAFVLTLLPLCLGAGSAKAVELTEETTTLVGFTYTVNGDITFEDRISVKDYRVATLDLTSGCTLTAKKGIYVPKHAELVIKGSGTLIATGTDGNAGLGGNNNEASGDITIKGGTVRATGDAGAAGIGGANGENGGGSTITISGGTVTAVGGGAGSGLGRGYENTYVTRVTISGGTVNATGGGAGGAGINASSVTITDGTVNATGQGGGAGIGSRSDIVYSGTISISGGTVTARGSDLGAGIGSGRFGRYSAEAKVTISGGKVYAYGSAGDDSDLGVIGAPGIGASSIYHDVSEKYFSLCGDFHGTVEITGGEVYAYGAEGEAFGGAGIGAGFGGNASDGHVIIRGGKVEAYGGRYAAGIGAGATLESNFIFSWSHHDDIGGQGCNDVQILGGTVIARAGEGSSAIGFGAYANDAYSGEDFTGHITFADELMVRAGNDGANYDPTYTVGEREGACMYHTSARIEPCVHEEHVHVKVDEDYHIETCKYCNSSFDQKLHVSNTEGVCTICNAQLPDKPVEKTLTQDTTTWDGFTYLAQENLTFPERIEIAEGKRATLVLNEGVTLNANKGIHVPETSTLVVAKKCSGTLIAVGDAGNAGIGGNSDTKGGAIRIEGGTVNATGGSSAPGIGDDSASAKVTINGGTVTAIGGDGSASGAGISASKTTITGGIVTATGNGGGAGIGSRADSDFSGQVIIEGGSVIATCDNGAGIGAGRNGGYLADAKVTISGGTVTATGGLAPSSMQYKGSAGIGASYSKTFAGSVEISGGIVTATGGGYRESYSNGGAGIGAGYDSSCAGGRVTITGGTVDACGGYNASAIGKAGGDSDCSLTIPDLYRVKAGSASALQLIASGERVTACKAQTAALIESCDHKTDSGYVYTHGDPDDGTHIQVCNYCLESFIAESHTFDERGFCKICDYRLPYFVVTFDTDGGSEVEAQEVPENNAKATKPDDPTREGYTFKGWQLDGVDYNFDATVTQSITLKAIWSSNSWHELQAKIANATNGDTIVLDKDVVAEPVDANLLIYSGRKVTIDLNDHIIDRGRIAAENNGHVIDVVGELTLIDSGAEGKGAITGGWTTENGGGVHVQQYGKFTMAGGVITGNRAESSGGGVYIEQGGSFVMIGGEITGNQAGSNGGGVAFAEGGAFELSGSAIIGNNTRKQSSDAEIPSNVYLNVGQVIQVTGTLDGSARVGVTMQTPGAITSGLKDNGTKANFYSDDETPTLMMGENKQEEAVLGQRLIITFDKDNGETTDIQYVAAGSKVTKPKRNPTKTDYTFGAWYQVMDEAGTLAETEFDFDNTDVSEEITLKAVWISPWLGLQQMINDDEDGEITLTRDCGDEWNDNFAITIPKGRKITIDLAGHTIDRARTAAGVEGCVIRVEGELIVTDSSENGTGAITGGYNIGNGGGVYVANGGKFTLQSGRVSGNTAERSGDGLTYPGYGGGVFVDDGGTFTMSNGAISANKALSGGGIYIKQGGSFTLAGGTIGGAETAEANQASYGGGVDVEYAGTFNLAGGAITGNTATVRAPGVDANGRLNLSGKPSVTGNGTCNVYLNNLSAITVAGKLESEASIGVTMEQPGAFTVGLGDNGTVANFVSDNAEYRVGLNADGEAFLGKPATVTFNANGGSEVEAKVVAIGEKLEKPADPTMEGYAFQGWQLNDEDYDFDKPVTGDMTLMAAWKQCFTVTFDANGGSEVEAKIVAIGEKLEKPADPTREGYAFQAWQLNDEDYDFETPVAGDMTLMAAWKQWFTVTFDINGGSEVEAQTLLDGETAEKPADQTREGYIFLGWYRVNPETDSLAETAFDFATPITESIQLRAVWVEPFGTPSFVIPNSTKSIEANAFEGIAAEVVEIPKGCTSIGDYAFKDCTSLKQIRIPEGCEIGKDAFDGCKLVAIYGKAGSPADTYCQSHTNCVFVVEPQN